MVRTFATPGAAIEGIEEVLANIWLGGRDSIPDTQIQVQAGASLALTALLAGSIEPAKLGNTRAVPGFRDRQECQRER